MFIAETDSTNSLMQRLLRGEEKDYAACLDEKIPTLYTTYQTAGRGQTGTLRTLLGGTELDGRVHAKSGTIAATKNFAGYIELPNGKTWVFAVMVSFGNGKAKQIQKVIGDYLLDLYKNKGE